jgi:hypothetical protein
MSSSAEKLTDVEENVSCSSDGPRVTTISVSTPSLSTRATRVQVRTSLHEMVIEVTTIGTGTGIRTRADSAATLRSPCPSKHPPYWLELPP